MKSFFLFRRVAASSNNHIKSPYGLGRAASLRAPYVKR